MFLVGLAFIVVPTARALWSFVSHDLHPEERVAALEIIFEPMNPARRFRSLESHTDAIGRRHPPYWEYRVEIKNNSAKTIRNVMVIVERTGQCPEMSYVPPFKRTQLEKCDINPGWSELVKVITWPQPKILEGMLAGESAWAYGPVKVTASADDTPAAVKLYAFNYQKEQMFFDLEVYG
jgi:hypothetical protein